MTQPTNRLSICLAAEKAATTLANVANRLWTRHCVKPSAIISSFVHHRGERICISGLFRSRLSLVVARYICAMVFLFCLPYIHHGARSHCWFVFERFSSISVAFALLSVELGEWMAEKKNWKSLLMAFIITLSFVTIRSWLCGSDIFRWERVCTVLLTHQTFHFENILWKLTI